MTILLKNEIADFHFLDLLNQKSLQQNSCRISLRERHLLNLKRKPGIAKTRWILLHQAQGLETSSPVDRLVTQIWFEIKNGKALT